MSRATAEPPFVGWMTTLGDVTRARILRLVERQELNVGELTAILDVPQSTTSRHLKQLIDDGWLDAQREGTSRLYRFAEPLAEPQRALWHVVRENLLTQPGIERDDVNLQQVMAARRSRSEAFFSTAADQWDALRDELFGPELELALVAALLSPRCAVADLGCGTGRLSALVAPFVAKVWSVDNSEAMLAAAGKRLSSHAHVELRRGALEQLPLPSQCVDVAVLSMVLHYVPEPVRALGEAARVLKPGGKLIVADLRTHEREDFRSRLGHVWSGFGGEQLNAWLASSGLVPGPCYFPAPMPGGGSPGTRPLVFIQAGYKTDPP